MKSNLKNTVYLLLFLFIPSAWAEDSFEVGVSGSYFNYEETGLTGQILNREKGDIYGGWASYRIENEAQAYSVSWSLDNNSVEYTGVTTIGNIAKSTTNELISNVLLKYEYRRLPVASVYVGGGYRYWRRDIQTAVLPSGAVAAGLLEKYHWFYLVTGVSKEIKTQEKSGVSADVNVKYVIKPNLDVAFKSGVFDSLNVDQGATWGVSASLSMWILSANDKQKWKLTPYIDYWHSDRGPATVLTSNGVAAGTVLEPESRTIQTGLRMSLSF